MPPKVASRIESLFTGDDGEFVRLPRAAAYSIVPSHGASRSLIYCTKAHVLTAIFADCPIPEDLATVARTGLPYESDVEWLLSLAAPRGLLFLGDLDPPDLLVFAWLREHLRPLPVEHLGIGDAMFDLLGIRPDDLPTIPLAASERAALPLLATIAPDLFAGAGERSRSLFQSGRKVELEAVLAQVGHSALAAAVMRQSNA